MANGYFGGGTGAKATPFLIEDAADLYQIRNHLSSYFKLTNNINLGEPPYNSDKGWEPIVGFNGVIDGNGKRIYNLRIARPTEDNVGFLSTVTLSKAGYLSPIRNISFENVSIQGGYNVGCLVGKLTSTTESSADGATFDNVYVNGYIEGKNSVGGFVGNFHCTRSKAGLTTLFACDCVSNVQLALTEIGNTYIGQFIGIISDNWASPASNSITNYNRCVGRSRISSASKRIEKQGNFSYDMNAKETYTNCFMDVSLWTKSEFNNTNAGIKYVDTTTLKQLSTQTALTTIMNGKIHKWSTYEGTYPQLTLSLPDYFLVKADGNYYYFDFADSTWKELNLGGKNAPSHLQVITYGLKTLQDVPVDKWAFFKKDFVDVTLYNAIDKTDSTFQHTMPLNQSILTVDEKHTCDNEKKVFMSMKVKMNNNYGVLSMIKGW